MRVIAIANNKGGCAKTTTTAHLGELLAGMGVRTLLVDLDPQANLSQRYEYESRYTIADALGGATEPTITLQQAAVPIANNGFLDLIPGEFQLANVAFGLLNDPVRGRTALHRALQGGIKYDLVIIDCPPEAGILLVNALLAADGVLLPAEPEPDAMAGITRVGQMIQHIHTEFERTRPQILGALATRVDQRTNRHRDGLEMMRKSSLAPLRCTIPERNGLQREQELRLSYEPVAAFLASWLDGAHA